MTSNRVALVSLLTLLILGVVSLLADLRVEGQLTQWGRWALALTVIAGLLGITAEVFSIREAAQSREESAEAERQRRLTLDTLTAHVRSAARPLEPLTLFYTLRYTATPRAFETCLAGLSGYKELSEKDLLRPAGLTTLGTGPIWNAIEAEARETRCSFKGEELSRLVEKYHGVWGETVVKIPYTIHVDLMLDEDSSRPSLRFKRTHVANSAPFVRGIEIFDSEIFQDAVYSDWEVTAAPERSWSIHDLENGRIRIQLLFMCFERVDFTSPPRFVNLHLYFGGEPATVLSFYKEQLAAPKIAENLDSPIRTAEFHELLMVHEFEIDGRMFQRQLVQLA